VRCLSCKYSLVGLTGPPYRCPECGREFDPNDPGTFASSTVQLIGLREVWRIACMVFLLLWMPLCAIPIVGFEVFAYEPQELLVWCTYAAVIAFVVTAAVLSTIVIPSIAIINWRRRRLLRDNS
jgi:hypothetical protein